MGPLSILELKLFSLDDEEAESAVTMKSLRWSWNFQVEIS
jgi:hypothetical protein